jgi:hypothetical protein
MPITAYLRSNAPPLLTATTEKLTPNYRLLTHRVISLCSGSWSLVLVGSSKRVDAIYFKYRYRGRGICVQFFGLLLTDDAVALYPATSESEKISFNQLNKQTGHRIRYLKVDADTGDEVPMRTS